MTESIHTVDASIRLPRKYMNIVDRSVALLRSKFEKGEVIYLHCFIGKTDTGALSDTSYSPTNNAERRHLEHSIKETAQLMGADVVLIASEGWSQNVDSMLMANDIYRGFGSVSESPQAFESCNFSLETPDGRWMAFAELKQKVRSRTKRTFGDVVFAPGVALDRKHTGVFLSTGEEISEKK